MSPSAPRFLRTVAVGVLLVASTSGAQALTVSRCNQLVDGTYRPVLVVENDGAVSVHQIGDDGLTRGVLFDAEAALQWAVQHYGADAGSSVYSGACTGQGGGGAYVPPTVVTTTPPADDDDDGGNYGDDDDDGGYVQF